MGVAVTTGRFSVVGILVKTVVANLVLTIDNPSTPSRLCQTEKEQSRLSRAPDRKVSENRILAKEGGSKREGGEER